MAPGLLQAVFVLRRESLSALENLAQSVGTMGPVATLGTVIPLLIAKSGNGSWLLVLGILAAFCLISANINVFASRMASAGSLSTFASAGLGGLAGSAAGWSYLIALLFVVTSSGVSSAYYLARVLSDAAHITVGPAGCAALTCLVVAAAWWPSYRDIRLSTHTMLVAEAASLVIIGIILVVGMAGSGRWADPQQFHLAGVSWAQFRTGLILGFMVFAGFESATTLGEEARGATRTLPKVMLLCLVPVAVLFLAGTYSLTSLSHRYTVSLDQTDAPLDLVARSIGLPTLGLASSAGIALSCFGCAVGGFNAGARVLYSMARERGFWPAFAATHPRNHTPHRALALFGVFAMAVPAAMIAARVGMADAMDWLMQIASFGFLGAYVLVCAAAPWYLGAAGRLTQRGLAAALGGMAVVLAALFLSLVPAPTGPARILPYLFAALLAAGMAVTIRFKRPHTAPRVA